MLSGPFSKAKYYILLALKNPRLILSFIYKKHLGVILQIPLVKDYTPSNKETDILIFKSNNVDEIFEFYKRMNRNSMTKDFITKSLQRNYDCFLVYTSNGTAIGGMWIFKKTFTLKNTSGRTLSKKGTITLDDDTIYGAYVIIDENFRGRGINQLLLNYVLDYYSNNSAYQNLLLITGASNGAYIRTTMKYGARLVGITKVINICGIKHRKEIFLDKKEKSWNND